MPGIRIPHLSTHDTETNNLEDISLRIFLTIALMLTVSAAACSQDTERRAPAAGSVHDFTMVTIDGDERPLSDYEGKVLLIVNTASKCGFTPQYESLETLYRKYEDRGFTVLAFPANNFGAQEPGTDEQIKEFCTTNYDVTFDLFSKISVKGDDMHPLYAYLTGLPEVGGEIKWNFTKFLVGGDGQVLARFNTRVDPLDEQVVTALEDALGEE